jgi:hypothetical protein
MKKSLLVLLFLVPVVLSAQEKYIELLRANLNTERVALITEAMELTDKESEIFWPIYRDYDHERTKLGDTRIAILKDYAANYGNLTDKKAQDIVYRSFDLERDLLDLEEKYYVRMRRELSASTAARFFQVERQLNMLIQMQVSSELPLVPKLESVEK